MFRFWKKADPNASMGLDKILKALRKNEITVTARKMRPGGMPHRSKFGGRPCVPEGFVWPRFTGENYDGETADRPLSFLCQINLSDIHFLDKDKLLPKKGILLFFYEMETMRWGFSPEDAGCARVYYFENADTLRETEYPADLPEEYRVKEFDLVFAAKKSYPDFEELDIHVQTDCDRDDYDETLEKMGYEFDYETDLTHKLLGYAVLMQGEMLSECECVARNVDCGSADGNQNISEEESAEIRGAAKDWVLLFQMMSMEMDDYELMFGDMGFVYFYIRKQDLLARNFDKVWLVLQCG